MFNYFTTLAHGVKCFVNKNVFPGTAKCTVTPSSGV